MLTAAAAAGVDVGVVSKLADFVEHHQGSLGPSQMLELLEASHLGQPLLLALCAELLARCGDAPGALPASLVMRYAQLAVGQLGEQVAVLQGQLQQLQQQPAAAAGAHGQQQQAAAAFAAGGQPKTRRMPRLHWRRLARHVALGLLGVTSLVGGNQLPLRLLRMAPLLFLLQGQGAAASGAAQQQSPQQVETQQQGLQRLEQHAAAAAHKHAATPGEALPGKQVHSPAGVEAQQASVPKQVAGAPHAVHPAHPASAQ